MWQRLPAGLLLEEIQFRCDSLHAIRSSGKDRLGTRARSICTISPSSLALLVGQPAAKLRRVPQSQVPEQSGRFVLCVQVMRYSSELHQLSPALFEPQKATNLEYHAA